MTTINVNHLKLFAIFVLIVESGSFSAAAKIIGSSRARVSDQLAQLETDLNCRLLHRTTRKLSLTSEGHDLYHYVRHLPALIQDIQAYRDQQYPHGRVRLTTTNDIAIGALMPVLTEFRTTYPEIQLDLILSDQKTDLIAENIDLAIRVGIPQDDSYIMRPLHRDHFQLYAAPDYIAKQGVITDIADLEKLHWIFLTQAHKRPVSYPFWKGTATKLNPESYQLTNSPLLQQHLIAAGVGVGFILPSLMRSQIADGIIIPILPDDLTGSELTFSLIYPSKQHLPLRTRFVIDFLVSKKIFSS